MTDTRQVTPNFKQPKPAKKAQGVRAQKVCSIEGCSDVVLARGWCGRHYSRWRKNGDPETLHPRLKGDPNSPVISERWVDGTLVKTTQDGREFTDGTARGVYQRKYGETFTCETCKKVTFARYSGANRFRFCSHKCAGREHSRNKLGKKLGAKSAKDGLDRLFSALIRSAAVCEDCGSTSDHQCAHGFSRRYLNVRWDMRNAFCLCRRCHMKYTWRPLEWDEWLRARWGDELYSEIRHLALRTDTKVDYDAIRDALVAEILRRDIRVRGLPKSIKGWTGLTDRTEAA